MKIAICIATLSLALLSACTEGNSARNILGLGRKNPDEFRVVSRPPLSMPPDFTLRPPSNSDDLTGLPTADTAARAAIIGRPETEVIGSARKMGSAKSAVGIVKSFDLESPADDSFLSHIGAENADDTIRETLNEEAAAEMQSSEDRDDSTFGWLQPTKNESEVIIDAEAEKSRILENKATGKKINEGEIPTIEPKTRGVLEKIL